MAFATHFSLWYYRPALNGSLQRETPNEEE
jgi:hypothetical protein